MMGLQQGDSGQEPNGASSTLECDFYMYLFKVQPCPKRGAHDWSSCPYAHPKEKARRRDPRVYKYASTPCPESLQGVNCGRGVDCPYAHSVYEYWLHPARFRTQMCKKGNQCNRTLCFFAHSASELRFPETGDDAEAAAVDAAAASASATPLPLCHLGGAAGGGAGAALVVMAPACGSSASSLPLVNLGSMSSDASSLANGGSGSFTLVQAMAASGGRQGSCASQLTALVDDMSGSFQLGGSDPGILIPGLSLQQQHHQQHGQPAQAGLPGASSLSEPLPRMGSDPGAAAMGGNAAAWLQLAAASQLPASQIMSSIRPPPAAALAAQHQAQQAQLLHTAAACYAVPAPQQAGASGSPPAPLVFVGGGSGSSAGPLVGPGHVAQPRDSSERLAAGLASMGLQGLPAGADDGSGCQGMTGVPVPAGGAAAEPQRMYGQAVYACGGPASVACSQPLAVPRSGSSRSEDFMLLQMLQEKQLQQQQVQHQQHALAAQRLGPNASGSMVVAGGVMPGQGWGLRLS